VTILPVHQHTWIVALVVAVATLSLSGCAGRPVVASCAVGAHYRAGPQDTCVSNASPSLRAKLLAEAREQAKANGGRATRAVAVESLRAPAVQDISGAGLTGNEHVWVVEISGHFRCRSQCFSVSRLPTGTVLTLYLTVGGFRETGLAIGDQWVDLSPLGPIVVLHT
jgi:hypothetical protein